VTDQCKPQVEARFHELTLRTECPGKPHLVKYSYFPKWKSDDGSEISEATNGFMLLTPKEKVTVLRHRYSFIDLFGISLSWITIGILGLYIGFKSRRKSKLLQA
jgi:hypothetical protein